MILLVSATYPPVVKARMITIGAWHEIDRSNVLWVGIYSFVKYNHRQTNILRKTWINVLFFYDSYTALNFMLKEKFWIGFS